MREFILLLKEELRQRARLAVCMALAIGLCLLPPFYYVLGGWGSAGPGERQEAFNYVLAVHPRTGGPGGEGLVLSMNKWLGMENRALMLIMIIVCVLAVLSSFCTLWPVKRRRGGLGGLGGLSRGRSRAGKAGAGRIHARASEPYIVKSNAQTCNGTYSGWPEISSAKRFFLLYCTGFGMVLISFGINVIIMLLLILIVDIQNSFMLILNILMAFFCHLISALLLYTTAVAAAELSGTLSGFLFMTVALYFQLLFLAGTILFYCCWNLASFYLSGDILRAWARLSPVSEYFCYFSGPGSVWGTDCLGYLAASGCLVFLALRLHRNRRPEMGERPVIFPWLGRAIQFTAVIACSLLAAVCSRFFAWPEWRIYGPSVPDENPLFLLFWFLFGGAVAYGTTQAVLGGFMLKSMDSRGGHVAGERKASRVGHVARESMASHWRRLGGCLAVSFLIFAAFRFDVMGYDRRLPAKEEVESVSLEIGRWIQWVDYGDEEAYGLSHMTLTDMDAAYPLLETASRQTQEVRKDWVSWFHCLNWMDKTVKVRLNLKNGMVRERGYLLGVGEMQETPETWDILRKVYEAPEYKQGAYPILQMKGDQVAEVWLESLGTACPLDLDEKEAAELLSLYQMDLEEMAYQDYCGRGLTAVLSFRRKEQYPYNGSAMGELPAYPLYPSFDRTNTFLSARGYPSGSIDTERIERIELSGTIQDGCIVSVGMEFISENPEEIQDILEVSVYPDYSPATDWYVNGYWKQIDVDFLMKGEDTAYSLIMNPDRIPDFLRAEPSFTNWPSF